VKRWSFSWLFFVPLTAVAGVSAHVMVQALAVHPHEGSGHRLSHVDVRHWPLCGAVCAAVGLAALLLVGNGSPRVPLWVFALVPPAGFLVQEEIFALTEGLAVPTAGFELLAGLVLQVPFALVAFLVARALLGLAATVLRLLRDRPAALLATGLLLEPTAATWRGTPAFVLGHGQRAPPVRL
jgi:hypothetical protein